MERDNISKQLGIVVSHTHWDREWRYPLYRSRFNLVQFMEKLIDLLESEKGIDHFVLDGQSVIIEDYLEIVPQMRERIVALITKGKLAIGPWYTLPDLFPVSGESLIRNLQKGIALSKEYGYSPTVAYTTFGWGQSAQLPQLYKAFNLNFVIVAKHVSPQRVPQIEFIWRSPDGSELLASRLGKDARANFYFNTYLPLRYGVDYKGSEYRFTWGESLVFKSAQSKREDEDFQTLIGKGGYFSEQLEQRVLSAWDGFNDTTLKECRLLLNGTDSTDAQSLLPTIIEDSNKLETTPHLIQGSLELYRDTIVPKLDFNTLQVVEGVLRDGPVSSVTGNALATRIPIKQMNALMENSLTRVCEPLVAIAHTIGGKISCADEFLKIGWDYLLKSQCHDSLNGVGQDKIAEDTLSRLSQVEEITQVLSDSAIGEIIKQLDCSPFKADDLLLFVYNPLPYKREESITFSINLPKKRKGWTITLKDKNSRKIPVQIIERKERLVAVNDPDARAWTYDSENIRAVASIGEVGGMGWELYAVEVEQEFERNRIWPPEREQSAQSIATSPYQLENNYLRATVQENGALTLYDKENNEEYRDLLLFEDSGDVGDYWIYSAPYNNKVITSKGSHAHITLLQNGPLEAIISISLELHVPKRAEIVQHGLTNEGYRADEMSVMSLSHIISLRKNEKFLRITTSIDNSAMDHRLRIRLPLPFKATTSTSMTHFYVDQRSSDPQSIYGKDGVWWPEMETHPMRGFADVHNSTIGLAILTDSFMEYEVESSTTNSSLLLTAFRSVRNKICTEFRTYSHHAQQTGGQLLQPLQFTYAILPHSGTTEEAHIVRYSELFLQKPLVYQMGGKTNGTISGSHSIGELDSPYIHISAFKQNEKESAVVMRLWNSSGTKQTTTFKSELPLLEAHYISIDELTTFETVPIKEGRLLIELDPYKVCTLRIQYAN